jgi:hypothetical protein
MIKAMQLIANDPKKFDKLEDSKKNTFLKFATKYSI